MNVSPDDKLAQIKVLLPEIRGIIEAEDPDDAERRATLTVWVQTATSRQLRTVIDIISRTRWSD